MVAPDVARKGMKTWMIPSWLRRAVVMTSTAVKSPPEELTIRSMFVSWGSFRRVFTKLSASDRVMSVLEGKIVDKIPEA